MSETTKTTKPRAKKPAAAAKQEQMVKCSRGITTAGGINFRKGPGFDSAVLRELRQGQMLSLKGEPENGFIAAELPDGTEGWVCAEWVEVIEGV